MIKYHTLFSRCASLIGLTSVLLFFPLQCQAEVFFDIESWTPQKGDTFHVDTKRNIGILLRADGSDAFVFKVVTGQKRNVRYLGITYYAATPQRKWRVRELKVQADRVTFGKTGMFMRMFNGETSTKYGIHGHAASEKMLERAERYESMGCIIVSEDVLKVLLDTYEQNGNILDVSTVAGLQESTQYLSVWGDNWILN